MFVHIRKHQKWLWIVISALVIISFVWYLNPQANVNQFDTDGNVIGSIYGRPVKRHEYLDAYKEAQLRYFFSSGNWPGSDEMSRQFFSPERETRNRLFLREKLREFDIRVTDAAAAQWIREVFKDENKVFRKELYDRFKERLPREISPADLERFIRTEVGIQHLIAVMGVGGKLVTPQEAEALYRRDNEKVETSIVFFNSTNFLSLVQMDEAALQQHYTNRAAVYRLPERVQLGYVEFPVTNYYAKADEALAKITNLTALIEQNYLQRGSNAFKDINGAVMDPAAAKEKIRQDERNRFALVEARKEANQFTEELIALEPKQPANLENLAAAKGIISKVTEPFAQFDTPEGVDVPGNFGRIAFMLTPEEPFTEQPVVGDEAVYIFAFKKRVPSELPPFEAIRERVAEDYRQSQARTLAQSQGSSFYEKATNQLASGRKFEEIAKEDNLTVKELTAFSQSTRSVAQLEDRSDMHVIKDTAFSLKPGEASRFTPTRDGGFIIYLKSRQDAPEALVKAELSTYLANLRRTRQSEAFQAWFRKELELAKVNLPQPKEDQNPLAMQ